MTSTGISREGFPVYGPVVHLAPDRHAFLVLGEGADPVITWSYSWQFASEQADLHDAVVVAVPVVRDSSWRAPHPDDPAVSVPVRTAAMPRRDAASDEASGRPRDAAAQAGVIAGAVAGYAVGRAARQQQAEEPGGPDRWSSARPDVVGDKQVPSDPVRAHRRDTVVGREYGPLERVRPFGDPAAPALPADPEAAISAAFGGSEEAVDAFHTPAVDDNGTLAAVLRGLRQ